MTATNVAGTGAVAPIQSLDEFFAEAERLNLTAADLLPALRVRPEFADCLSGGADRLAENPRHRCEPAFVDEHGQGYDEQAEPIVEPESSRIQRLCERLEHTEYWYGVRFAQLFKWAHTELSEQLRQRYFSIVANGTPSPRDPPTFAQQFNRMKHRMERAEAELARAQAVAPVQPRISWSHGVPPGEQTATWQLSVNDTVVLSHSKKAVIEQARDRLTRALGVAGVPVATTEANHGRT